MVATTSSAAKAAKPAELGADTVIDYAGTPERGRAVPDATGGCGVGRIVEVDGPGTFARSLVAAGTHHAEIGFAGGGGAAARRPPDRTGHRQRSPVRGRRRSVPALRGPGELREGRHHDPVKGVPLIG
ncbi:hypothetical protein [Amycolatopsis sp. WQ 127309]|uniref:hypothetical protein n=1 Tax=Amycolatopsis sp. WQ 127309 TaxID=2932773 RepID=UPI001FF661B8|nr:hypothetical protein [Amycolatopsis sp. WQ 127309]UOZ06112.1 hypothetical protein MUY22_46130 [Amycolatopsis sp. WQ 127309]